MACLASSWAVSFSPFARWQLGQRLRVARLSHEDFARLHDGLLDLPRVAQRAHEQRASFDGQRVCVDEVREQLGRVFVLPASPLDLGQRDDHVLHLGRQLVGLLQLFLGRGQIACAREDDAQVEARLPEVGIDGDGLTEENDRALALAFLGGPHPLHHLAHGRRIGRRERLRPRVHSHVVMTATARSERERERHGREPPAEKRARHFFFGGVAGGGVAGGGTTTGPLSASFAASGPRLGASIRAGIGDGPSERTSKPTSLNAG